MHGPSPTPTVATGASATRGWPRRPRTPPRTPCMRALRGSMRGPGRPGLPAPGGPTRRSTTAVVGSGHVRGRPDQEAALRRLRAAFGFVEALEVVDHDEDNSGAVEEDGATGPLAESAGSCQVPRGGDLELGRDVEPMSQRRLPGGPARPSPSTLI